ncbi:MAG: ice-binding family protein [Steroidobacteraceae bacterium]
MKTLFEYAFRVRRFRRSPSASIFALSAIAMAVTSGTALATPLLGSDLASFTVLGGSTVTNVPTSAIVGNVGVWSSGGANAITGFNSSPGVAVSDPQVTAGTVQAGTSTGSPNAMSAQLQLASAIASLGSLGPGTLEPADLTGLTLLPGVYTVSAGTTNLSGTLTLDGNGNANAAWVFQMPSTLITSPDSVVTVSNTGPGAGVYWNVGSSATIDTGTTFVGNILARGSITMNSAATDGCGRALAQVAVTLEENSLSGNCLGVPAGSGALSSGLSGGLEVGSSGVISVLPYASVPEPSTLSMLILGLIGVGFAARTRSEKAARP